MLAAPNFSLQLPAVTPMVPATSRRLQWKSELLLTPVTWPSHSEVQEIHPTQIHGWRLRPPFPNPSATHRDKWQQWACPLFTMFLMVVVVADKWTKNLEQAWPGAGGATDPRILRGWMSISVTECLQGWGATWQRKDSPPKGKTVHAQRDSEPQVWRLLPEVGLQSELTHASVWRCYKTPQVQPQLISHQPVILKQDRSLFGSCQSSGRLSNTFGGFSKRWTSAWPSWKVLPECEKMGGLKGRAATVSNLPGSTTELW